MPGGVFWLIPQRNCKLMENADCAQVWQCLATFWEGALTTNACLVLLLPCGSPKLALLPPMARVLAPLNSLPLPVLEGMSKRFAGETKGCARVCSRYSALLTSKSSLNKCWDLPTHPLTLVHDPAWLHTHPLSKQLCAFQQKR